MQFEKIKKYLAQIDELNKIKQDYEVQRNNLRILNEQVESQDKKERNYQAEVKRLKNLEEELKYSNERIKAKEDEILRLVNDKANLENEIKSLYTGFNDKKMQLEDKLEEFSGENAMFQNQISLLNANITNLTDDYEKRMNQLKEELDAKHTELDDANQRLDELNSKLNRKVDEMTDLKTQIFALEHELKLTRDLNDQQAKEFSMKLNKKIQENECLESVITQERFFVQ